MASKPTVHFSVLNFQEQPKPLRDMVSSYAEPVSCSEHEGSTCFELEQFQHLLLMRDVRIWLNKRFRAKDNYTYCKGTHTKEDIECVWEIQRGLCYYTGEPLKRSPKNFDIDHKVPQASRGTYWPDNIVLAISEINRGKKHLKADEVLARLAEKYGKAWLKERRSEWKRQDKLRLELTAIRRKLVCEEIDRISQALTINYFPHLVELDFDQDDLSLEVDETSVLLPAGIIRKPKIFSSMAYYQRIADAILSANKA